MATYPPSASTKMKWRKEQRLFSAFDESAVMKQVQATHAPHAREFDVKPLVQIVDQILVQLIANSNEGHDSLQEKREHETLENIAALAEFDMLDSHAFVVYKISNKLSGKFLGGGGDGHGSTMVLLNYLSAYAWNAKVVLTLAAFAATFGGFWLIAQLSSGNTLVKPVTLLRQMPDIIENSTFERPQLDALNELMKLAVELTKCIVEFKELSFECISQDTPLMSIDSANIPIAAYWVIRSVVACASQTASLIGMTNESLPMVEWNMSNLACKVSSTYDPLKSQLAQCKKYIDDKREKEAFHSLLHYFEETHIENVKILKAMVYEKDVIAPLIDGSTKSRASLEVLREKYVLLLISDLDISIEEIIVLDNLYKHAQASSDTHYEIIWIPIVDKEALDEVNQQRFEYLQSLMAWYIVCDPFIEPSVINYIKEKWNFTKRAIAVVLDPQGRVCSPNALHMLWIWGNMAFPFTREKEESLWNEEIWSLDLLVDGLDPTVLEWIDEGKFICLYGGQDQEWIQTFTATAMNVAKAGGVELEMVYAGTNNAKERMQKIIDLFARCKFSHYWPNVTSIWFFWTRLESMLYSKLQHDKTMENDHIMREVTDLLCFDGADQEWAIFSRGASEIVKANGDIALKGLKDFDKWKDNIKRDGLVVALYDYMQKLQSQPHCNCLILPSDIIIPEKVLCADCGCQMEMYIIYNCYHK